MAQSPRGVTYHRNTVQPPKVKAVSVSLHTSKEPMADSSRAHLHTTLTFQAHRRQLPSHLAATSGPSSGTQLQPESLPGQSLVEWLWGLRACLPPLGQQSHKIKAAAAATESPYGELLPRRVSGTCSRLWVRSEICCIKPKRFSCLWLATATEPSPSPHASNKGNPLIYTLQHFLKCSVHSSLSHSTLG